MREQAVDQRAVIRHRNIHSAVVQFLFEYRAKHSLDTDEQFGGLPLVDVLTPPGEKSIELGIDEVYSLADYLTAGLMEAPFVPEGDMFTRLQPWSFAYCHACDGAQSSHYIGEQCPNCEEDIMVVAFACDPAVAGFPETNQLWTQAYLQSLSYG